MLRGGKRKRENRTQNSICSGLDGSFFSLEIAALNPICGSCQLCPRVPCGSRKKYCKLLTSFTVGQVRAVLTYVGSDFVFLNSQRWMCYDRCLKTGMYNNNFLTFLLNPIALVTFANKELLWLCL